MRANSVKMSAKEAQRDGRAALLTPMSLEMIHGLPPEATYEGET